MDGFLRPRKNRPLKPSSNPLKTLGWRCRMDEMDGLDGFCRREGVRENIYYRAQFALDDAPDGVSPSGRVPAGQLALFGKPLPESLSRDRDGTALVPGEPLGNGEGRVRIEQEIITVEPAYEPAARLPFVLVEPRDNPALPFPTPGFGVVWRVARLRVDDMG